MASNAIRKVQDKLFRGNRSDDPAPPPTPPKQENEDRAELPSLTINIPKPPPLQEKPQPPPKLGKLATEPLSNGADEADVYTQYRQRLAQKLGGEYQGAEKYRLQQADKREKHWKRWGPYLSDRQWASNILRSIFDWMLTRPLLVGHRTRGLLRQWRCVEPFPS
jgi:hypothetical protein